MFVKANSEAPANAMLGNELPENMRGKTHSSPIDAVG